MRIKGQKIPDNWVRCDKCLKKYGFISTRVSQPHKNREVCLTCLVEEDREREFRSETEKATPPLPEKRP